MAIDSVDLDSLSSLYAKSPEIKAIIDWLDDRERDPRAPDLVGDFLCPFSATVPGFLRLLCPKQTATLDLLTREASGTG